MENPEFNLIVVFDTNVFVSGVISPKSIPAELFQLWRADWFTLVTCQRAIDELEDVLTRPKIMVQYQVTQAKREALLEKLRAKVVLVSGDSISGVVVNDPKDDMFVACAVEGKAKYIISGDKHLHKLRRYNKIRVLEPTHFLRLVERCKRRYFK